MFYPQPGKKYASLSIFSFYFFFKSYLNLDPINQSKINQRKFLFTVTKMNFTGLLVKFLLNIIQCSLKQAASLWFWESFPVFRHWNV